MKLRFSCILFFLPLLVNVSALAYIPEPSFILDEAVKTHGKGVYSLEFDVIFKRGQETASTREKWIVENGAQMNVTVSSGGNSFSAVYGENTKTFLDESGQKQIAALPPEFFEGFFHVRSGNQLAKMIATAAIAPASVLSPHKPFKDLKEVSYPANPYLRLSRTEGVVTYMLGAQSPAESEKLSAGVWFDQDRHWIRRIRLPSSVNVRALNPSPMGRGLTFPKSRIIQWGEIEVVISTVRVEPLIENEKIRSLLSSQAVATRKIPFIVKDGPLRDIVREFYSRYR